MTRERLPTTQHSKLTLTIFGGGSKVRVRVDDGYEPKTIIISLAQVPALLTAFVQAEGLA